MGRKNEGILDLLIELPWWGSVIVSAVIYGVLKWILPIISFDNVFFKGMAQALPNKAGFIAFVFLIPAPFSALNSWRKRQRLDKHAEVKLEQTDICPRCNKQLQLKIARKGPNAGSKFYGCSGFPDCKFTKSYQD